MFRKVLFWMHLSAGVAAGLVILMMSVTGVVLTYERQLLDWAERDLYATPPATGARLPLKSLLAAVRLEEPGFEPSSITISADPAAPAAIVAGRAGPRYVNVYTGEMLGEGAVALRRFFAAVTGWHRWFNVTPERRAPWRAITGAANLLFLFLVLSGLYLWLPRVYRWAAFRGRLVFNAKPPSGHARDFNWHHVLGIWSAMPLAVVVATAVVFSYPWANNLVYLSVGEEPPRRGPGIAPQRLPEGGTPIGEPLSLDALLATAANQLDDWQRITLPVSREREATVRLTLDSGNGGQPQRRQTLVLDANTGRVVSSEAFADLSTGQRARSYVRFLHTGEALGLWGQTLAGLVSLTSVVMVWTGLALAYRRLLAPLFKRRLKPER